MNTFDFPDDDADDVINHSLIFLSIKFLQEKRFSGNFSRMFSFTFSRKQDSGSKSRTLPAKSHQNQAAASTITIAPPKESSDDVFKKMDDSGSTSQVPTRTSTVSADVDRHNSASDLDDNEFPPPVFEKIEEDAVQSSDDNDSDEDIVEDIQNSKMIAEETNIENAEKPDEMSEQGTVGTIKDPKEEAVDEMDPDKDDSSDMPDTPSHDIEVAADNMVTENNEKSESSQPVLSETGNVEEREVQDEVKDIDVQKQMGLGDDQGEKADDDAAEVPAEDPTKPSVSNDEPETADLVVSAVAVDSADAAVGEEDDNNLVKEQRISNVTDVTISEPASSDSDSGDDISVSDISLEDDAADKPTASDAVDSDDQQQEVLQQLGFMRDLLHGLKQ